ncbi:hypothetical protein BH23GEM11_BH23GEM11_13210 [soil metagenome]
MIPPRIAGVFAALAVLTSTTLAGCTLERRADPDAVPDADTVEVLGGSPLDPPTVAANPSASVRVTMEVFREATRVGDVSLALQLLDSRALLMDDLVLESEGRVSDLPATRGEHLLELRRRHAAGLFFEVLDSDLRWLDETAVLTTRLLLLMRSRELDAAPDTVGVALESAFLRPSPEGWRIVHMHRSVAPGSVPIPDR